MKRTSPDLCLHCQEILRSWKDADIVHCVSLGPSQVELHSRGGRDAGSASATAAVQPPCDSATSATVGAHPATQLSSCATLSHLSHCGRLSRRLLSRRRDYRGTQSRHEEKGILGEEGEEAVKQRASFDGFRKGRDFKTF